MEMARHGQVQRHQITPTPRQPSTPRQHPKIHETIKIKLKVNQLYFNVEMASTPYTNPIAENNQHEPTAKKEHTKNSPNHQHQTIHHLHKDYLQRSYTHPNNAEQGITFLQHGTANRKIEPTQTHTQQSPESATSTSSTHIQLKRPPELIQQLTKSQDINRNQKTPTP